jgi:leucyl aminopeptidase
VEFSIKSGSPEKHKCDCLVVGVFESRQLSVPAKRVDKASGGHLGRILDRGDLQGKSGTTLLLHGTPGIGAARVLLVGLGKESEFGEKAYREALAAATRALRETGCQEALYTLSELAVGKRPAAWRVRQAVLTARDAIADGVEDLARDLHGQPSGQRGPRTGQPAGQPARSLSRSRRRRWRRSTS